MRTSAAPVARNIFIIAFLQLAPPGTILLCSISVTLLLIFAFLSRRVEGGSTSISIRAAAASSSAVAVTRREIQACHSNASSLKTPSRDATRSSSATCVLARTPSVHKKSHAILIHEEVLLT